MHIDDLVRMYQSKSDGELIKLAGEADQLTTEAYDLLMAELFRRRIPLNSTPSVADEPTESANVPSSFGVTWLGNESTETIDDFVRLYQSKSDEELIQLAEQTDQLTREARSQLAEEL